MDPEQFLAFRLIQAHLLFPKSEKNALSSVSKQNLEVSKNVNVPKLLISNKSFLSVYILSTRVTVLTDFGELV